MFSAISATAPVAVMASAVLPLVFPRTGSPSRVPIYAAVALLLVVGSARALLHGRLSAAEQAVLRFWAFAPTLTLLTASVLGGVPLLALDALEIRVGDAGLLALGAVLAVASGGIVWALWLRLRDSLGRERRDAP